MGIYLGTAVAGCEPSEMGIGPIFAVPKLLEKFSLNVADIDLWELNEAFAVQVVYCRDQLKTERTLNEWWSYLNRPSWRWNVWSANGRSCAD